MSSGSVTTATTRIRPPHVRQMGLCGAATTSSSSGPSQWIRVHDRRFFIHHGSEDQKFTLGTHYVDHDFGPHVVPVLTDSLEWYDEKVRFDTDVVGAVEAFDPLE